MLAMDGGRQGAEAPRKGGEGSDTLPRTQARVKRRKGSSTPAVIDESELLAATSTSGMAHKRCVPSIPGGGDVQAKHGRKAQTIASKKPATPSIVKTPAKKRGRKSQADVAEQAELRTRAVAKWLDGLVLVEKVLQSSRARTLTTG